MNNGLIINKYFQENYLFVRRLSLLFQIDRDNCGGIIICVLIQRKLHSKF